MQILTFSSFNLVCGGTNQCPLSLSLPAISSGVGASVGAALAGPGGAVLGATLGSGVGQIIQENNEVITKAVQEYVYSDDVKKTMYSMNYLLDYLF